MSFRIQAAVEFVEQGGERAVVCMPEGVVEALEGRGGLWLLGDWWDEKTPNPGKIKYSKCSICGVKKMKPSHPIMKNRMNKSNVGRVKKWLSPPPPHQTVRTDFPYTAFVWHCPIAGDGFIN